MILVNEMTSLLFMIAIETNTHKFANLNTLKSSMKIPTRIPSPKLRNVRHKSDPFRPSFCVREFYINISRLKTTKSVSSNPIAI